ncbi:MAG: mechanosensitive ion channel [Candidatus Krumholzibacteria bacterium]|nr:mechanosensitive ion channel [Candidatus Krumholzibacteria bacterium]MDH4335792.1 mechanosensitive ion channel [Candidatus Krumholzibacteria bacterium]MDH5269318.1 mechanosensitive ion channel [Candidatus Krumholzibacteria bacterium]
MGFLSSVKRVLDQQLFSIGDASITVSTLATVVLVMIITVSVSRLVRAIIARAMMRRGSRPEVAAGVTRLVHYVMILAGVGVAFAAAGIDIGSLFTAGAIFAVGLGFAMQNIAQNFVAGVILQTERTIRPGDVLGVEGNIVRVTDIGIRASIVQTRDGEDLVIPNSTLIQETVKNYTLKNATVRIRVPVGVVYGSDMALVKQTLTETAKEISQKWAVPDREPLIAIREFGDNSVNWEIGIWMDNPWEWRPAISELHEAVWWAFKAKGIVIAFPQLDVHLDPPIAASLERISTRGAN